MINCQCSSTHSHMAKPTHRSNKASIRGAATGLASRLVAAPCAFILKGGKGGGGGGGDGDCEVDMK